MGIGKREFLRLTTLALAGAVINPLQSVVTVNDVYINKKLGILFHKPSSWEFINVKDFGRLKNEQILGNGWNESKDEIWAELGEPICIVTKHHQDTPEYKGIFSPTITLNITPVEELEYLGHQNFKELIEMSEFAVNQLLNNFTVVKRYDPYYISGCKFYEFDAEYFFEHVDIDKPLMAELKVLKTEHNGFYYDFNCHQSLAQNQTAYDEFEEFKNQLN